MRKTLISGVHFLIILFAFQIPVLKCDEKKLANQSEPLNNYQHLYNLYSQGGYIAYKKYVERLVDGTVDLGENEKARFIADLIDSCVMFKDYDCLVINIKKYLAIEEPTGNIAYTQLLVQRKQYYGAILAYFSGNENILNAFTSSKLTATENTYDTEFYIKRQLLRASIYLERNSYDDALISLDQVTAQLLSISNPDLAPLFIAQVTLKVVEGYFYAGEKRKASSILYEANEMLSRVLPIHSIEFIHWKFLASQVSSFLGYYDYALEQLRQLDLGLTDLNVSDSIRSSLYNELNYSRTYTCLLAKKPECVNIAIDKYATLGGLPNASFDGQLTIQQSLFLGMVSYHASQHEKEFSVNGFDNKTIATHLEKYSAMTEEVDLKKAGLEMALGFSLVSSNKELARRYLKNSFSIYSRFLDQREMTSIEGPSLGSAEDKYFVSLYLYFMSEVIDRTEMEDDLIFSVFRHITSGIRAGDAYAAYLLSQVTTDDDREKLQSTLRLKSRKDKFQVDNFKELFISTLTPKKSKYQHLNVEFEKRTRISSYSLRRRQQLSQLDLKTLIQSFGDTRDREKVMELLSEDEALLFSALNGSNIVSLCLTRTKSFFAVKPIELQQAILDWKLLNLALTADHSPSEVLDSQFPVKSAINAYEAFIKPQEQCLVGRSHINWLPSDELIGVPLTILLKKQPKRLGFGYDLKHADWLVNSYSFSSISSLSALFSSRRKITDYSNNLTFLGVGNPDLVNSNPSAAKQIATLYRNSSSRSSNAVNELIPLPETEEELTEISDFFPSRSVVLVKDSAGEAEVRSALISGADYLAFATHGLITGEIPGLSESALVLTPLDSNDPNNDGLLTASEIADLSLTARLVTLSACNTASYDQQFFQSEIRGLTGAFSLAGVPAVLVTLWPVESTTSKEIVRSVYEQIIENSLTPSRALAASQRKYLMKSRNSAFYHPRFWSPFMIYGDGDTFHDSHIGTDPIKRIPPDIVYQSQRVGSVGVVLDSKDAKSLLIFETQKESSGKWPLKLKLVNKESSIIEELPVEKVNDAIKDIFKLDGGTVVIGYNRKDKVAPFISVIDESLHEKFRYDFNEFPNGTVPYAAIKGPSESIYFVVSNGDDFWLITFDPKNKNIITNQYPAPEGRIITIALALNTGILQSFVTTLDRKVLQKDKQTQDAFHNLVVCFSGYKVDTYLMELTVPKIQKSATWNDRTVNSAVVVNGKTYLAGRQRKDCLDGDWFSSVVAINGDFSLSPLFSGNTRNSFLSDIAYKGGKLISVGSVSRSFDVKQANSDYSFGSPIMIPGTITSGLILQTDLHDKKTIKTILRSGGDVFLDYLFVIGGVAFVSGTNASRPTVWSLTVE